MNLKVRAKRRSYMYATIIFLACLLFPLIGCGKRVYGAFGFCGGSRGRDVRLQNVYNFNLYVRTLRING